MTLLSVIMAAANIQRAKYEASVFSYLGVNLRNRLNHEWVASTTQRRALKVGSFSMSCFSSPRGRMWGINPYFLTRLSLPINAASRHRFWSFGDFSDSPSFFLCFIIIHSSKGPKRILSCRLAPSMTSARGTPRSSVNTLRLVPFFSPIRWVWANRFLSERRFNICSIC